MLSSLSGRKPEIDWGGAARGCLTGGLNKATGLMKAARQGRKRAPTFPPNIWARKAPTQVTPGSATTRTHVRYNPKTGRWEQSVVHYDQYGRQIGRTDYSTHGYPDNHTNPHHHEYTYGSGYGPTGMDSGPLPGIYQNGGG